MFALRERFEIIRALWERAARSEADEHAYDEWSVARFDAYASMMVVAALVVSLMLALVSGKQREDLPGLNEAFASIDLMGVGIGVLYLGFPRPRFVRRNIRLFAALVAGSTFYLAIAPFAKLGGPAEPYVHIWAAIPLWTVGFPARLRARTAFNAWLGAAIVAGTFVPHPGYWSSPWAAQFARNVFGNVALSTALGLVVEALYRKTFFQMKALARQGEVLEERVVERTQEVRHLVAHMAATQEAERTRIARDLHDDLGQELAALRYAMEFTRSRFAADPTAIAPNLAELHDLLARTTSSMQGVMAELRPRILDDMGFSAAGKWLASRVAERSSFACEVAVEGSDEGIDEPQRTAAFRILQEALTNVLRHADARHAKVTIAIGESALDLTVVDDGKGLPAKVPSASAERPAGGMGVLSMRERATSLGGTLVVADRAGGGVEVRCELPLGGAPSS